MKKVEERSYSFGLKIGRTTNDSNQANLLAMASKELAKASSHYRRANDEQSRPHKQELREAGLAQTKLGIRFVLEFLDEARERIASIVANHDHVKQNSRTE